LYIPPRLNNSSICSTPVSDVKPPNKIPTISVNGFTPLNKEMVIAAIEATAKDKIAGTFLIEKIIKIIIGIEPAYQLTSPVSNKPALKLRISLKSDVEIFVEIIANNININ